MTISMNMLKMLNLLNNKGPQPLEKLDGRTFRGLSLRGLVSRTKTLGKINKRGQTVLKSR